MPTIWPANRPEIGELRAMQSPALARTCNGIPSWNPARARRLPAPEILDAERHMADGLNFNSVIGGPSCRNLHQLGWRFTPVSGPELTQYDVDVEAAALARRGTVTLPANVHYAWPHASSRYLYVASSDSAPGGGFGGRQASCDGVPHRSGFGCADPHGGPIALPTRPIHTTTDIPSAHVLVAFNNPSALQRLPHQTVTRQLGTEVREPSGPLDFGVYGSPGARDPG